MTWAYRFQAQFYWVYRWLELNDRSVDLLVWPFQLIYKPSKALGLSDSLTNTELGSCGVGIHTRCTACSSEAFLLGKQCGPDFYRIVQIMLISKKKNVEGNNGKLVPLKKKKGGKEKKRKEGRKGSLHNFLWPEKGNAGFPSQRDGPTAKDLSVRRNSSASAFLGRGDLFCLCVCCFVCMCVWTVSFCFILEAPKWCLRRKCH